MTFRLGGLDGYSTEVDSADSMVDLSQDTAEMFEKAAEEADLAKKKKMACPCGGTCECHKAAQYVQDKCMKCMGEKAKK